MRFCRRVARQLFFERRKADKRHIKELRKGSVHNLLTTALQKILLGAAGLTMLSQPLFAASQSKITALGGQTKIEYDDTKKTHTITTTKISGENAFNAFKNFTLNYNEIANLQFPKDTKNLLNFVNSKINIQGTLNAIKDSKIGGNLYFLSSEGLILGRVGVINAGAFYAMTPTKDFMKKFINADKNEFNISTYDVSLILDRKIANYNAVYNKGVTINPTGEIIIEGQINTINGIGLYAGGNEDDKKGIFLEKTALLNTFSKDNLSSFKDLVNVDGLSIPDATEIVEKEGHIELVSTQNNLHHTSSVLKLATGYSSFKTAQATAKTEVNGSLNSRGDISITALAANGQVVEIDDDGKRSYDSKNNKLSEINSNVVFGGKAVANGNISLEAISDNENVASNFDAKDIALELLGGSVKAFPLNVDADVLLSKSSSVVEVKSNSVLDAQKQITINAITNSTQQEGVKTATSVSLNVAAKSKLNRYLPAASAVYAESESSSTINFDGKAISHYNDFDDTDSKSISLLSESNSELDVSSTAATGRTNAPGQVAFALGKNTNKANLTIGEHASFETEHNVEIQAITNSSNSVTAASKGNKSAYFMPAVALSLFNSDSTLNINKSNINLNNPKGSFTLNALNNIMSEDISAESGITSPYSWEKAVQETKDASTAAIMDKLRINQLLEHFFPDNDPQLPKPIPSFSITGSFAYGGGSHNAIINIKPSSKIITPGDLNLKSKLYINDTKYDVSSFNYPDSSDDGNQSAKTAAGLAVLVSNYDYNSKIVIDDSTTNSKTQLIGNKVSIDSSVEQPYNRVKVLVESLKEALDKLNSYFTEDEHKAACEKVKTSFEKLFESNGSGISEVIDAVSSLAELAKLEGLTLEDGIPGRLINFAKAILEFKGYNNYANYSVSSYVNSAEGNTKLDFSGSVFVGTNKAESDLFVGKNTLINSNGSNSDKTITLDSRSDITNTALIGGIPLLAQNTGGEDTVSIGGSSIVHVNNSESKLLVADGASIGSNGVSKVQLNSYNQFKPVDIVIGTSSASKGFNAMASVLVGNSKANVLIDNSVNIAADTIALNAYNNTEATNIVGSIMLSENLGIGVGAAVTALTKESRVLYDDNDLDWQKIRKELGLRTTDPEQSEVTYNVATITADVVEAVAKTTGTINTIGVAGSVAVDDRSSYDKWTEKGTMVNDFLSDSTINNGTDFLKYKLIGKIFGVNNQDRNIPDAQQQQQNQQQAQAQEQANPEQGANLSLTINGSVAVNKITNTTKVDLNKANIEFNDKTNSKVDASAINSAHHLSFAGAAGIIAQGGDAQGTTAGVDGSIALNLIDNETESKLSYSNIYEAKQINSLAINGGETIAVGLGLQVNAGTHDPSSAGSGAVNASINLIENDITSQLDNVTTKTNDSSNKTNMVVAAYESDTQVTGGVSAAVGKQKGAVGVSLDIAKIDNTLTSEISNSNLTNMNNIEVNALQASTIVNAGIAVAVAAGTDNSVMFSGSGVYSELVSNNSANIKNSTINSENLKVRAQDVRTNDEGVSSYEANLDRNGKDVDFVEKDGKSFYTDLETASGTTEIGEVESSREGSLFVTASVSGGVSDTAIGLGAAINEIDNSFNVNVSDSNITSTNFDSNAISHTNAITIGIGAAVSTDQNKGSGVGSAAWNSIRNKANIQLSKNTIKSDSFSLKSLNDSTLIGIGGAVSVTTGNGGVGASIGYNAITNTANSELFGGDVTGISSGTSKLNVTAENDSNIWGIALSVGVAKKVAVGGTVVINEIDNNATAQVGDSKSSKTNISEFKSFEVSSKDSSDIKSLSGAVTGSKEVAVGGAVAVNQIGGETLAGLENTSFNSNSTKLKAYSDSEILSMAIGAGGSGKAAVQGAAVVNDIFRDVSTKVKDSTTNNSSSVFEAYADSVGKTGGLSIVAAGSGKAAIGAGVSVNRIGGEVSSSIASSSFKLKSLYSEANSNKRVSNIGVGASGSGNASVNGSVAYNEISGDISSKVTKSTIEAENNISVVAKSDDTVNNYVGQAEGSGKAAVGVSLSINNINGDTTASVRDSNITAKGNDSNDTVSIDNVIDNDEINNKYASVDTIDINYSLHDKRKGSTANTGLQVDSSSTHTLKSFVASIGGSGAAAVNANVNVNLIKGNTKADLENSSLNNILDGKTAGNVAVKASDYTNTAGFIGSIAIGGYAGVGASFDTNKISRNTLANVSKIKEGSVAKDLQVKANSKQGFSSVVAGIGGSGYVGVAGNVSIGLNNGTTEANITDSKISVNSVDVEANHYTRGHVLAGTGAVGITVAGVGASVVVTNDKNTVNAEISSSTIDINKDSGGDVKVNAINDDDFEAACASLGGGLYAGVAGSVVVNYMENQVESNVASSTIGSSDNRANSITIKSKDVSDLVADGGTIAGGAGAVGASVFVNTYEGQTNTRITDSKIYSQNNIDLGAYEERNGDQYAVGVAGGVGAIGSNILVINSGKKLDLSESGSLDVSEDFEKALDMAIDSVDTDYVSDNNHGALTDEELKEIFKGKPTYLASEDGNSVTLTNIDKSIIDSQAGKISSNTEAKGTIKLSNYGGAAGAGAVLGGFGFIYDDKNVVSSVFNSSINAGNGIDIKSLTGGNSNLNMIQASAGLGDYCGAFAYVNLTGQTAVGIAGSKLTNKSNSINIIANDEASANNEARGYTFGGVSVGTIISKAKNGSISDVTISNSSVANEGSYTASNTITISAEKNNSLTADGYSGNVSGGDVIVVSTLAEDVGRAAVKLGAGNYFEANELNALASNRPDLCSQMFSWSGSFIGIGVGDVTTRESGAAKLNTIKGSKYNVNTANFGATMDSESSQVSEAYTVSAGADIHVNRADTLSKSFVEADVNIGEDDFKDNTILNVYAENNAYAEIDVKGVSVGGVISVANNQAKGVASLTTNVNVDGASGSHLSQINAHSSSSANHKLHANGDGGGIMSISPYAASTYTEMNLKTNTNLSNDLSADKISAEAIGNAKGELTSDAIQGELVGGCGTQADFDFVVDTNVNINDNANLTANTVDLKSQNDITTDYERNKKNNKTKSYGLETGARVDSDQTIDSTSQVNIGKNTTILASEQINIDAKTKTDLFNKVQLGGAGFGSHLGSHAKNDYTFNNKIITQEGSLIKTDKKYADINIAASYDIDGDFSAYTEVEGAGEGNSSAEITNEITINDTIDINGNIYSYNDLNLYTDKDTKGVFASLKLDNEAEAYTRAVVPWETSANIDNDIERNNSINISSNSSLDSVKHTTLSASDISLSIKNYTKEYNWYEGSDESESNICTVSDGISKGDLKEKDVISVEGKVTAGIQNNINVKIDGTVVFDENITGDGVVRAPSIECNNKEYQNAFKTGTMDYGNELFARYQEVEKLYNEYSSSDKISLSYKAEMDRLINEMEKYGLYDPNDKSICSDLSVDYIELPDMVCSGGNIYINAKDNSSVSGSGMLKAQGAPQIKVENNSNLYMKVNDLTVVEPGGDIIFNKKSLGDTAQNELSKVATVETDDSKGSEIRVNENWKNRFDVNYKDPADGQIKSTTANPLTNIEINGHIIDNYGSVIFYNANKDIVLQGKTAKDSASIDGASISISAPKGSIAQGYTQGITNIGYTPEAVLDSYATAKENKIKEGLDLGLDATKTDTSILTEEMLQAYVKSYQKPSEGTNQSKSGVWIAGGSVYLNGEIINLNGTIQSGYSKFEVTLSDDALYKINIIKNFYNISGNPEITQAYLEQNCRINEGGMLWDDNIGAYKYVVQAYYNPKTDSIILEDIQSSGGKIYLTGKIVNTSGGKIYAADGSSDIDIKNNTGYKLTANTLDVGDRKGFISIMDLAKSDEKNGILATLTEMTSDSTKVWYVTKEGTDKDNPNSTSGLASSYEPLSGLTYNWSTGYKETFEYRYESSYKFTVWGAIDYDKKSSSTMMQKIENGSLSPSSSGTNDKLTGRNIETPIVNPSTGYSIYFKNSSDYRDGPNSGGHKKYNSWVHFSGTYYGWAEYKYGSTRDYHHSIKADYPISIKFLSGDGNINLTTNSDLQLNSDVISKYGEVTLTTTNGSIEQHGGKFITDKIHLNATTGIGANEAITQKMQSGSGVFSAITQSGNVNLISNNYGALKDTTLKLTAVTDNGDTNVVADASLLQGGNDLDVKGSRIDLTSKYGSIGTKDALLKVNAGQEMTKPGVTLSASINAQAYGDIALNQTEGDMRLGKIISDAGDVYLTSAGSVFDALPPKDTEKDNQSSEKLIEKWKEMGIISEDGKNNSEEKRQEAITAYENSVKTSYARYSGLKERFEKDKKDTSSESYKEYQTLKEKFGNYASADEWLEAQNKDKNSQWYKLQNEVVFGWTQDALLYAIQDSIINREEGSTIAPVTPDDANIKARNVTIKAGGGIGKDEGYTVVDISDLHSEKGLEALKAIAGAEASDVIWGYDGDKVDKNKATINKVNALMINANGTLEASANGNIYFEDVNNNEINLISISSNEGSVRVYGNNGIYNATAYTEGDANNIINISGKDLIIEAGKGSIGSTTVPLTTNMFGAITARSSNYINLYQIGNNAMTFAQVYAGGTLNIRALKDILSVYNGEQAKELGYIHSKDDMTLYSYEGDIGQSDGKGLRVKLEKDKSLNAEAESVYLKGYGDTSLDLGNIIARSGDIGVESKTLDLVLKDDISAQNLEFRVSSINQEEGKLTVGNRLLVTADNGIVLDNSQNYIPEASLINNKSGAISLYNNRDLTLYDAVNKAEDGDLFIVNEGSVTANNGISSEGNMFVWANGDIDLQKDSSSKKWAGLYAENGGIKTKSLFAESIDFSVEKNGLTTENIVAEKQIKANVESGDIQTEVVASDNDGVTLITHDGNITSSEILAKKDINIIAYNGDLNVNNSINSINGFIEAVGYKSLSVDSIKAALNLYVGSLGDVIITSLMSGVNNTVISDIFDELNIKENTSYLLGKNIKVDNVVAYDYFEAISKGKFTVNDKIIAKKDVGITAHNEIEINSVKSVGNLDIASVEEGAIKINESITENGKFTLSNTIGDIELGIVNAGGDVLLNNTNQGDITIKDSIKTQNNGSLYVNVEDGDLYIKSGDIKGKASFYSEKGAILLTKIDVIKDLDVRAKDGAIGVGYKTTIGGNATLKSDTDSVIISDAEVGGNLKLSAQDYSYVDNAEVGGSMLMKGLKNGCYATSLIVGKDLIMNTDTGNIIVNEAEVGNNSYISIDGQGQNIEIKNIKTGNGLTGNLIVVSHSERNDINYIDIENATATNKLIINSEANIKLKSAYALNGKLEVKAGGDVFADFIKAAKNIYISTLIGFINIKSIISGDRISISSLGKGMQIDDIVTLNPEADIDIIQWFGDIKISNASSAQDLEFTNIDGKIELDKVSVGRDVNISGGNKLFGGDANISINNSYVGNDINLNSYKGDVNITKTTIGNNLTVDLNGEMNVSDVNVGNNSTIVTNNNSIANFNRFKSDSFNLIDKGYSNLNINNSEIEKANVNLNANARITDSNIDSIKASVGGDLTITNLTNSQIYANASGSAKVTNLTSNEVNAQIGEDTLITNSNIDALTSNVYGIATFTDSTIGKISATVGGDLIITNLTNSQMYANASGSAKFTNLTSNDATANIDKDALITNSNIDALTSNVCGIATFTDSTIGKINATVGGDLIITNLTNSQMYANASGSTKFTNLISNEITAKIDKDALITNSNINALTANVRGIATFTDSTIGNIKSNVTGDLAINNLVNNISSLEVSANTTIASITSNDLTAIVGGNTQIADSSISKLNANSGGNLTLANLSNKHMNAVVGGNADVTNLDSEDSIMSVDGNASIDATQITKFDLTVKNDAQITNSDIDSMKAKLDGKSIISDSNFKNIDLTNAGEALIKDSTVNSMDVSNAGKFTLNKLKSSIVKLDLNNTGEAIIESNTVNSFVADNSGQLNVNDLTGDKLELTSSGNTNIADSTLKSISANNSGKLDVKGLTSDKLVLTSSGVTNIADDSSIKFIEANNSGELNVNSLTSDKLELINKGNTNIAESSIKAITANNSGELNLNSLTSDKLELTSSSNTNIASSSIESINANNSGKLDVNSLTSDKLELTSKGNTNIAESSIKAITANNSGELKVNSLTSDKLELTSKGNTNIADSSIKAIKANSSGEFGVNSLTSDKLELTSSGNTNIASSSIESINAINSGKLDVNELTSDKFELTSKGNTNIAESNIKAITANNSGELNLNRLTSDKFELNSSGKTNLADSNIINVNVNTSGIADINKLVSIHLSFINSGSSTINATIVDKMKFTNSGKTNLNNIEVNNSAYVINNNGNLNIDQLNVANNFDLDSKSGNINMSGIDISNDFNFALKGNSGVKFTDITIGHDFNVYAGKAVLNGSTLNVENNLNTYTYSKYSAPKSSLRTAIKQNNGTTKASENEEGFTLILKELNIGGGLYVDNPDVTIEVEQSKVKQDVKIDSGKENIDIKKLDVEGGSLDIKGDSGAIKLGEVNVDNKTKINLGSGNLDVSSMTTKLDIGFNAGGNISSDKLIKSESSTVNAVAGGNLTASTVEAKGKIDFKAGGNISSDQNIETQNESVNMIAGGSINAYKVLAQQQGNIEAVNGDIIIGQIDGRTLVFKQDTNDKTLRIREANVETKITASADYIDIEKINHNGTEAPLDIEFGLINSRAMDNVVIKEVKTAKGVDMFNLISMYGNIFVDNSHFDLTKTYLLKMGDLKTPDLKFRIFGDNPKYDKGPDIIAFFAPKVNHKMYANISFEDNEKPGRQDYIPLIAKGSYKKMFNQYTVVQEIYALHLAYEERIEDVDDESYNKFDYRKLDNSKSFYVEPNADIYSDGETVNLDDVDIPVAIEFDSVNGELKPIGTHLKPMVAED